MPVNGRKKNVTKTMVTMVEDLSKMWLKLSLREDGGMDLDTPAEELHDGVARRKFCIMGKLIADRIVSRETIKMTLMRWWKLSGNFSFQLLGEILFMVEFTSLSDKMRIMEGRPWIFKGSLFLIEDFDGLTPPSLFTFEKARLWVRMVGLPLTFMNQTTGQRIGSMVWLVEAVDIGKDGISWGEFRVLKL
jgi:hypothetical protein